MEKLGGESARLLVHSMLLENRYRFLAEYLIEKSHLYSEFKEHKCFQLSNPPDLETLKPKLSTLVEEQIPFLLQIPKPIRDTNLGNYFEELIAWAVGSENVIAFLTFCF